MKAISPRFATPCFALFLLLKTAALAAQTATSQFFLEKTRTELRAARYRAAQAWGDSVLQHPSAPAASRAEAWMLKGRADFWLGQYAPAENSLQNAYTLARQTLGPSAPLTLEAQVYAAWNHYYNLRVLDALAGADSVLAWEGQVQPCEAFAFAHELKGVYQGECYLLRQSLSHFRKGKTVRDALAATDSLQLHQSYKWFCIAHRELGAFSQAMQEAQMALALLERHGGNSVQKAMIYHQMAYLYDERREPQRMLTCMQTVETLLQQVGEVNELLQMQNLSDYARAYTALGDSARADSLYRRVVTHWEDSKRPDAQVSLCHTLHNYSNYLRQEGRFAEAARHIQQATRLMFPQLGQRVEAPYTLTALYNGLIGMYVETEQYAAAQSYFDTITTFIVPYLGPSSPVLTQVYNNYGLSLFGQEQCSQAIALYDTCLHILQAHDAAPFDTWLSPVEASYALWNRAEAEGCMFTQTGDSTWLYRCWQDFDRYVLFLDFLRASYRDEGSQANLASENRVAYEYALTRLFSAFGGRKKSGRLMREKVLAYITKSGSMELQQAVKAKVFEYISKSSAMTLLASVNRSGALSEALPERWADREQSLRRAIAAAESELLEVQGNRAATAAMVGTVQRNLAQGKQAFYRFLDSLKVEEPAYHAQRYQPEVPTLSELQKILRSENQGFVAYFVGTESLFTLFATADTVLVSQSPVDSLTMWVSQFNEALTAEGESVPHQNRLDARYRRLAYQLYNKLLGPFGVHLPRRFVVATDGCLRDLAFDALLLQDAANERDFRRLPYLGGKYVISCNYSAGLLREMRDKQHLSPPAEEALVLAPFHAESGTSLSGDNVLPMLESSGREADSTARAHGVSPRLGNSASKDFFLKNAHRYRVIVLITHGGGALHEGDSEAWIALAVEGSSPLRYERLTVREVYLLSLNADLVVLSACETGLGKEQIGEGNLSLARAFAYAGAKAVINSYWSVDDESTEQVMKMFHQNLNNVSQPMRIDEALWLARNAYLKNAVNSDAAHPRIWAGFAPAGDMRPMKR